MPLATLDPAAWAPWAALGVGVGTVAWAARRALRPLAPCAIPVLRYRLVGPPRPGSTLNDLRLPLSQFDAHMRHVARRGLRPVTLSEAIARRRDRAFVRSGPVALTFDGPYACFREVVWPVLERWGLTAVTLFVPPQRLGDTALALPEGRPEPLLSPDDLRAFADRGVEVGIQSGAATQARAEALADELRALGARLAGATGKPPALAAFPGPAVEDRLARAARAAGLRGAVSTGGGALLGRATDPFAVRRFVVQPDMGPVQLAFVVASRVG